MFWGLLPLGDLHSFIVDEKKPINWPLRMKIAMDIAKGMDFLHSSTPPVVHRDLKSPVSISPLIERKVLIFRLLEYSTGLDERSTSYSEGN